MQLPWPCTPAQRAGRLQRLCRGAARSCPTSTPAPFGHAGPGAAGSGMPAASRRSLPAARRCAAPQSSVPSPAALPGGPLGLDHLPLRHVPLRRGCAPAERRRGRPPASPEAAEGWRRRGPEAPRLPAAHRAETAGAEAGRRRRGACRRPETKRRRRGSATRRREAKTGARLRSEAAEGRCAACGSEGEGWATAGRSEAPAKAGRAARATKAAEAWRRRAEATAARRRSCRCSERR